MKSSVFMLTFFVAHSTLAVAAPALSVSYTEGSAYLRIGSSWHALSIGDSVPAEASVRLDEGASVQLKGIGTDIYLTQKGTYAIRDLLAARQRIGSVGIGKVLMASLALLRSGPAHNQSAVLGARGGDESKGADSDWVETSAQEDIEQGKNFVQSGKYPEAIEKFNQALEEATVEELAEVHYYLAYAYSLEGNTPDAFKALSAAKPMSGASWAGDCILLRGKLYIDTFAFGQAVRWLTQPGNDLSADAQRAPLYYFLLGLGYRGMNDASNAAKSLQKVASLAGDSDLGKSAAGLLQNQ